MKQKAIIIALALVLTLSMFLFCACDDKNDDNKGNVASEIVLREDMTEEELLSTLASVENATITSNLTIVYADGSTQHAKSTLIFMNDYAYEENPCGDGEEAGYNCILYSYTDNKVYFCPYMFRYNPNFLRECLEEETDEEKLTYLIKAKQNGGYDESRGGGVVSEGTIEDFFTNYSAFSSVSAYSDVIKCMDSVKSYLKHSMDSYKAAHVDYSLAVANNNVVISYDETYTDGFISSMASTTTISNLNATTFELPQMLKQFLTLAPGEYELIDGEWTLSNWISDYD